MSDKKRYKVSKSVEKFQKGGSKEQYYTYANSKNKYKKVGNKWYISNEGTDFKFVPIQDPTGSRTKELNKNAKLEPEPWVKNPNSIEGKINKAMGDPQGQAARAADWHTPKDQDQRDNLRHSDAARRTQQAIANATGSDLLGYYGSIALGTAHELGTMFSDDRPWYVKVKEAKEDFDNNLEGAKMGYFHTPNATKRLSYLSNTFQMPDGYGAVKPFPGSDWTDPYDQIQRQKAQQEVWNNPNPKPVGITEKFQKGGITRTPFLSGTYDPNEEAGYIINLPEVKIKPEEKIFKFVNPYANPFGKPDSNLENIAEIFDPTGTTSWDDIIRSYRKSRMSPETWLEVIGAIPLVGKAAKTLKALDYVPMTTRQRRSFKNTINLLKGAGYTGRASDAKQAYDEWQQGGIYQNTNEAFPLQNTPSIPPIFTIDSYKPFTIKDSTTGEYRPMTEEEKAIAGRTFMQDWATSPMAKSMLRRSIEKDAPYGDLDKHVNAITNLRYRATSGEPTFEKPEAEEWIGETAPYMLSDLMYSANNSPRIDWEEALKRGIASKEATGSGTGYKWSGTNLIPKTEQDRLNIEKFKNLGRDSSLYLEGIDKMGVMITPEDFTMNLSRDPKFATIGMIGEHAYVYPHEYSHQQDMAGSLMPFSDFNKIKSYQPEPLFSNQEYADLFKKIEATKNSEKGFDRDAFEKEAVSLISKRYPNSNAYNVDKELYEKDFEKFKLRLPENMKSENLTNALPYDEFLNKYATSKFYVDQDSKQGYYRMPTETRARLNALRFYGQEHGIYNPFYEELTPEAFQKLIEMQEQQNPRIKDANQLQQLRKVYTDEQIFDMLNTVAKNNNQTLDINQAKFGGVHSEKIIPSSEHVQLFQNAGMKTTKSKEGTITNKFINKKGQTVVQVKTKDGRYYEKVLEPQIKPLDNTPRYQNALLNNPAIVADNTRVIQDNGLPKDIQEVRRRQEAAQRAFEESRRDEIKQGQEYGIGAKTWDVITNPFTAAEYIISGGGLQNMPRNINEMRIAGIDPGVVQGRNLVGNTVNAFTNLVDAGDKVIRNVGKGNYLDAGLEAMRFIPSARLSTGLGKKVINNTPNISKFLPTYKNVYRVEPTSYTKDVADNLSGRWFGDLSEMPFYIKHSKDPEAGIRMIRAKVPTKTWESISGYNMPINARLMSGGTGNYKTFMDAANAGEIPIGAARRLQKGVPIPSDLIELSSNPRLINLSEGILPELKANKYRVAKPKKFSPFDRVEFPSGDLGREGAFDYIFNVSKDVEKPIFGIPRKYFPFQEGGVQNSETRNLSRSEIKALRDKGYNVKYL